MRERTFPWLLTPIRRLALGAPCRAFQGVKGLFFSPKRQSTPIRWDTSSTKYSPDTVLNNNCLWSSEVSTTLSYRFRKNKPYYSCFLNLPYNVTKIHFYCLAPDRGQLAASSRPTSCVQKRVCGLFLRGHGDRLDWL